MSCVSKSITEHALRERLTRTIRLGTFERLLSFHRFVFSGDSASRLACVRALILALPPHFMTSLEDCADEVAQLLVGCKRLRYLELHWYDLLTLEDPRLPSIVASLTELRAFDASERPRPTGISPESEAAYINTFTTLQSTLDSLRLPWIYAEDVTFFHDLAISQPCLKELWFSIPKFLPLNTPFRSVSRLHLTLLREYPRIRDIYRAFPSARDIRIGWIPSINLFRLTEADTAARHLAEEDCRDGNVWRSLDLLSSSFQYLCIFALTCPVRRLVLRDLEFGLWFWSDQAVELLSRLRPRQLDVVVDCGTPMDFPVPIDPRMFVNDSGASPYRLAHLCARIWFHPEGGVPDTDNVIVSAFLSFFSVLLNSLSLTATFSPGHVSKGAIGVTSRALPS